MLVLSRFSSWTQSAWQISEIAGRWESSCSVVSSGARPLSVTSEAMVPPVPISRMVLHSAAPPYPRSRWSRAARPNRAARSISARAASSSAASGGPAAPGGTNPAGSPPPPAATVPPPCGSGPDLQRVEAVRQSLPQRRSAGAALGRLAGEEIRYRSPAVSGGRPPPRRSGILSCDVHL